MTCGNITFSSFSQQEGSLQRWGKKFHGTVQKSGAVGIQGRVPVRHKEQVGLY